MQAAFARLITLPDLAQGDSSSGDSSDNGDGDDADCEEQQNSADVAVHPGGGAAALHHHARRSGLGGTVGADRDQLRQQRRAKRAGMTRWVGVCVRVCGSLSLAACAAAHILAPQGLIYFGASERSPSLSADAPAGAC